MTREDMRERIACKMAEQDAAVRNWTYRDMADAIMDELGLWEAYEALKAARPRLAHVHTCWSCRPACEWAEYGSASFENCTCEIKQVDATLARLRGETK